MNNTAITKYITILLLLLCSQKSNAQRTIEWYEPDFDSSYARHYILYSDLRQDNVIPHYSQFVSTVARKRNLQQMIAEYVDVEYAPFYKRIMASDFDRDGRLITLQNYGYKDSNGRKDTFWANVARYSYKVTTNGIAIHCVKTSFDRYRDSLWISDHNRVFFYGVNRRLDSMMVDTAVYRHSYDSLGRLIRISTSVWPNFVLCQYKKDDRYSLPNYFVRMMDSIAPEHWNIDGLFASTKSFFELDMSGVLPEQSKTQIFTAKDMVFSRYRKSWDGGRRGSEYSIYFKNGHKRLSEYLWYSYYGDYYDNDLHWYFAQRRRMGGWKIRGRFEMKRYNEVISGRRLPKKYSGWDGVTKFKYQYFN